MKKLLALVLTLALCLTLVAGAASAEATGKVYYLNFKPEADEAWQALAKTYTEQTGVPVTVVTAASGTYEDTLRSEMEKADAPTLFQVNGPVGLKTWRDYCLDLRDTALYRNLKSDDFALIEDGQVLGIAYVIETYGLIYNRTLLDKYMALDGAVIQSADQINNFETLKGVAEDIQARREELGVLGAFTSAGMDASSDWRFKTTWPTCPYTMNTRRMALTPPRPSRARIWRITNRSGIYISTTPPASPPSSERKRGKMPPANLRWEKPCSTRTAPGPTPTALPRA